MRHISYALAFLLATSGAFAQTGEADIAQRARTATHIAVGTVVDVTSHFDTNAFGDRLIYSDLLVEVSDTLKGTPAGVLTITVEGGEVNGLALTVSDMPAVHRGDRALYLLVRGARGSWVPQGRAKGILKMDANDRLQNLSLTLTRAKTVVRDAVR